VSFHTEYHYVVLRTDKETGSSSGHRDDGGSVTHLLRDLDCWFSPRYGASVSDQSERTEARPCV
jgi:hypothetical protein